MLSTNIKEATKNAHLSLEKGVVQKMKAIRSDENYADFLKYFYAYFNKVEQAIAPYITTELLPDHAERRNSSYLKQDIEALGFDVSELPQATAPKITNVVQALGALYVLEGSIMGGSIIIKMLEKSGVTKGISFFSGYGEASGMMWGKFIAIMNEQAKTNEEQATAIETANQTFLRFSQVFGEVAIGS